MCKVSSGVSAYNWTDYDKKIKAPNLKEKLGEALSDNKLTGTEINKLKEDSKKSGVSEEEFYNSLSSVTGVNVDKLKSSDNSPVEFTFNIDSKSNKVSAIIEDQNEDGDGEATTTKDGGKEATVSSPNAKTPENLRFKDYKTNNFNEATKTDKKSDFITGGVAIIKTAKIADAVSDDKTIPAIDRVKNFQTDIGLKGKDVDGKFGPKTLSALAEKYTDALNSNPPDTARAEKLGKIIDSLIPSFEGTSTGNSLKELRNPEGVTKSRDTLSQARSFLKEAGDYLTNNKYDDFKATCERIKNSNLPGPVISKLMDQMGKMAEKKLIENIGTPPAQNLTGTHLIDVMPDDNSSKIAFKTMYKSDVKDGVTSWTLKNPTEISDTLKTSDSNIGAKIVSSFPPKDAGNILKGIDSKKALEIIEKMPIAQAVKILESMTPQDAAKVLISDKGDKTKTASILYTMDPDKSKAILEFTQKPYKAWTDSVKDQISKDLVNNIVALEPKEAGNRLKSMDSKLALEIVEKMPTAQAVKILESMTPQDAAKVLISDKGDKTKSADILLAMNPDKSKAILEFTQKPYKAWTDSVKSEMDKRKPVAATEPVTPVVVSPELKINNNIGFGRLNRWGGPSMFTQPIKPRFTLGENFSLTPTQFPNFRLNGYGANPTLGGGYKTEPFQLKLDPIVTPKIIQ